MSTFCSIKHFFPFFASWNYFIYSRIYSLFIFSLIFFFYYLFITSILHNKLKLHSLLFFHYYESRATMCESIFKKLSNFTFFSDITYMKNSFLGDRLKRRKKHFYFIRYWFIFFCLIDIAFCPPVPQFLFCNKLKRIRRQNFGAKVA